MLKQMLIDTGHIDHIRVNFISHFDTKPSKAEIEASKTELTTTINKYPLEMTSDIRQWLDDQETNHITAPLATVDSLKSIDDFEEYIKEIEENLNLCKINGKNENILKVKILFIYFFL